MARSNKSVKKIVAPEHPVAVQDTARFNRLQLHLVHDSISARWPVSTACPLPGALLPHNRIVAYYGNFYTPRMGILGEIPADSMLAHLSSETKRWQQADTALPVLPALHYIAVTAQSRAGKGNRYNLRMPDAQIDKALELARSVHGILFLDVQVGWSTLQDELPLLEKYLLLPEVHLGIDPEFSMKTGKVPGSTIGTFDAADVNYAISYLSGLVDQHKLPPKVLVVHRFTKEMITRSQDIKLKPEVQVVINMDGFGFAAKKKNSYRLAVVHEPVQYAGFKLFYKNDLYGSPPRIMTPAEVLQLYPSPVYIQYQ